MKKMFFLAATAALALSSCSSDEIVQGNDSVVEDGAVSFSAYTGRANRATDITDASLKGIGFGVFAYEQGTTPWSTYSTYNTVPNFMYNQKVACEVTNWKGIDGLSTTQYEALTSTVQALFHETTASVWSAADIDKSTYGGLTDTSHATVKSYWDGSDHATSIDQATYDANPSSYAGFEEEYYTLSNLDYATYSALTDATLKALYSESTPGVWDYNIGTIAASDYSALSPTDKAALVPNTYDSNYSYSPVKYFSNNEGAKHSFFAYAPYDKDVKAVFSLANGAPAVRYNAAEDLDLVWASATDGANKTIDLPKLGVDDKITFNFKHALAKVSFQVTYFDDKKHDGTHTAKDDKLESNTTITVRSVKFVGPVPSQGVLNLGNGNWTYEATEEGAYEFAPAETAVQFVGKTDHAMTYKDLKQKVLVLPTIASNNVQVQVVYDVTTVDPANPRNNSTVTNTRTSEGAGFALDANHQYLFKLDLGITSVKFNATVGGWDTPVTELDPIDLPDNK